MKFSELESLMLSRGVTTLADIARALSTTPQAVSNWKARNQIPYHIVAKLNQSSPPTAVIPQTFDEPPVYSSPITYEEDTISLSDILLTMAEQLKIIIFVPFITVFLAFTYVQFIKVPLYVSWATLMTPSDGGANLGGLGSLASQFGVRIPEKGNDADLSSTLLFPELIRSRTFAETILDKKFYTKKFGKRLPLLTILNDGEKSPEVSREKLVQSAVSILSSILSFEQASRTGNSFSIIKVTAFEPVFAKELTEVALSELEKLNRYFKKQSVSDKIVFIKNRIASVEDDLEFSEQHLKEFNEKNRQVISPALQLELDRLTRDVDVQKNIYLTLKEQLELAKIEEVEKIAVMQVLDRPQIALDPSNKNLLGTVFLAAILGLGLGSLFGFVRSYINNSNMDERKKIRRVKHFFKKKTKDLIFDRRISGITSIVLLIGLPFYLRHKSSNPIFFGMYSTKLMLVNVLYILILLSLMVAFILSTRHKNTH